jgi:hypothetical protein
MWPLLLGWWQRSYGTVIKWVGIAAAVLLVLFNIRQSGRREERAAQLLNQQKDTEKANEVEADMRRLSDGAALNELRRDWSREQ